MVQDVTVRGVPRMVASLLHDMVTMRGVESSKDQTLRRISIGRVGKRWKVVSVDIAW